MSPWFILCACVGRFLGKSVGTSADNVHTQEAPPAFILRPPWPSLSLSVSRWGYRVAQGFVFAIEEINRDTRLLPNLTLGFSIRNSGDSVHGGMYEMLGFLSGQEVPIPNYVCGSSPPRVALIGETLSVLSVSMARLLGLYKFPQVSHPEAFSPD